MHFSMPLLCFLLLVLKAHHLGARIIISSVGSMLGFLLAKYLCPEGSNPASDASKNIQYKKTNQIVPALACINGLTVTFQVAVVSQGISRPNAENCPGFPHH